MFRATIAILCLVVLSACATQDPAKLATMSGGELVREWDDFKSEKALAELQRRNFINADEVPLIRKGTIRVGMTKAALMAGRGVQTWPAYSDADGNEVYQYGETYVKVVDDKVADWWSVSR